MARIPEPVLFLTHGAGPSGGPSYYMDSKTSSWVKGIDKNSDAANFLRNLFKTLKLEKPKAMLVLSAHWEEKVCTVQVNDKPELYFDYGGFPPETYQLEWDVPGAPDVARRAKSLLESKGIECKENTVRGLDHGVFVPLKLAVPEADIPVCQVSLLSSLNIEDHMKIGEALSDLRNDGVLIVGSGSATHAGIHGDKPADWAYEFKSWIHDVITNTSYTSEQRKNKFQSCLSKPCVSEAHPRIEHFLPIVMSCAAAGYRPGKVVYSKFAIGSLLNEHYMF